MSLKYIRRALLVRVANHKTGVKLLVLLKDVIKNRSSRHMDKKSRKVSCPYLSVVIKALAASSFRIVLYLCGEFEYYVRNWSYFLVCPSSNVIAGFHYKVIHKIAQYLGIELLESGCCRYMINYLVERKCDRNFNKRMVNII